MNESIDPRLEEIFLALSEDLGTSPDMVKELYDYQGETYDAFMKRQFKQVQNSW